MEQTVHRHIQLVNQEQERHNEGKGAYEIEPHGILHEAIEVSGQRDAFTVTKRLHKKLIHELDYRFDHSKIVEKRIDQSHARNQRHKRGVDHSIRDHYDVVVREPAQAALHYANKTVQAGQPRPFAVSNPFIASHTE